MTDLEQSPISPITEIPIPFNIPTLTLNKDFAKRSIFQSGRNPIPMRVRLNRTKQLGFIQNDMGITLRGNPRLNGMATFHTELDQQKQYNNLYDRDGDFYKEGWSLGKNPWGRSSPIDNLSVSVFHRPTRHALCDTVYRDKDMKNAHISMLCEIFKNRPDMEVSALVEYNRDPKHWRTEVCRHHGLDPDKDKDSAKQLFIRLVFGGTYEKWVKDYDIERNIRPFERFGLAVQMELQLEPIREAFFKANPQMVKDLRKHNPAKYTDIRQLKRSVLSFALQTLERWLMEACCSFLQEEKGFDLRDIVPAQDGLMVLADLNYEGMEADFTRIIQDKFGMMIEWLDKPFDEAIEIPDGVIERSFEEWLEELSDAGVATRFHTYHKNRALTDPRTGTLYVFDPIKKRWFDDAEVAMKTLRNMICGLHPIVASEIDEDCSLTEKERISFKGRATRLLKDQSGLVSSSKRVVDTAGWSGTVFNSHPTQLGYENGWLDLVANDFFEYREDVYITQTTGYDWVQPDYSDQKTLEMRDTLIHILADTFNYDLEANDYKIDEKLCPELFYYILVLTTGLDRNNYQNLFFFRGTGGNGKTQGTMMLRTALGGKFYKRLGGEILKEDSKKANQSSGDVYSMKDARMGVFPELDKSGVMSWSALKELTGGEAITAREIYMKVQEFLLTATFICVFNKQPEFVGSVDEQDKEALSRRLRVVDFKVSFASSVRKLEDELAKAKKGKIWKLGNPYFTKPQFAEEIKFILVDFLSGIYSQYFDESIGELPLDKYCPASVMKASSIYVDGEDVFAQIFNELFEEDASYEEDTVVMDKTWKLGKQIDVPTYPNRRYYLDVWNAVETHDIYCEKSSVKKEGRKAFLRSYTKKTFREWIEDRVKMITNKKTHREYFLGYRSLRDEDGAEGADGDDTTAEEEEEESVSGYSR
jgi:phage/plasmid-associated DNA primase